MKVDNRDLVGYYAASSGISYRCFGTTFRSHLQGSRSPRRKLTVYSGNSLPTLKRR